MIHPTAIVDPSARLGKKVEIGPFTIIGPQVRIGDGCKIGGHVVIARNTRMGRNNRVFQFASVGEDPQDKKYDGEETWLEIGDENVIREYATIHRGTIQDEGITCIGDRNLLMAYTHVAHDCILGNDIILSNGASLAGHVQIDDKVILGGFTLVHQFCRIGAHAFAGMGSTIDRDVLPYVTVDGQPGRPRAVNIEGLKRHEFTREARRGIEKAFRLFFRSGKPVEEARQAIEDLANEHPEVKVMVDFLAQPSKRGILRGRNQAEE